MNEQSRTPEYGTFLFWRGPAIVQWTLLASLLANALAASLFFIRGDLLLGLWALFAAFLFPRSLLALFLIHEREGMMFVNLTPLLKTLYRRTVVKYQPLGVAPLGQSIYVRIAGVAYATETAKLLLWLVPLAVLILPA
jgi:hypothetical protein